MFNIAVHLYQLLLLTCKVPAVPDVILVSPDEGPELQHDLNVLLESLAGLEGVHLVRTEEVQTAGVDPLPENVFSQGPRHHIPLQQRHPAVQQSEPCPGSSNVSRHCRARLATLDEEYILVDGYSH